jgi:hypothetical protein
MILPGRSFDLGAAAVGEARPVSFIDLTLKAGNARRIPGMDSPSREFARHATGGVRRSSDDVLIVIHALFVVSYNLRGSRD